jgi:membrane-associated phospholipid phosphatase
MPDWVWTIGLALANEQAMLPIGIGYGFIEGFYRKQWKPMLWFVLLLITSTIISEALKQLFKVPLLCDPTRYGFPSGHTQFATIFYGWICYQLTLHAPRYLRIIYILLTLSILACGVTSIVHYGYHTWFDIIGGLVSGGVLLFLGAQLTLFKPKTL